MEKKTDITGTIFKIKRFSIHDGPGIRTSVFLKGCPLNCVWCHSPEGIDKDISIWHEKGICIACGKCVKVCQKNALEMITGPEQAITIDRQLCSLNGDCVRACPTGAMQFTGYRTKVSGIMNEIEKDMQYYRTSGGGITLTGGEPLYQPEFSMEILKECSENDIHTAIETSLFCERETLIAISDYIDLFIVDIKISDPFQHIRFTGKSNVIIKENFRYLARSGKPVIVRIPLIEKITDTEVNKHACESFVHEINDKIPVEYISFNPLAGNNYKKLGIPFLLK